MTTTKFNIISQALIGMDARVVQSFSETGKEAQTSKLLYETAKDSIIAEYPWHFAKKSIELGKLPTAPIGTHFLYEHTKPVDCLFVRNCVDENGYPVDYEDLGATLLSSADRFILVYSTNEKDENILPTHFVYVLIAALRKEFVISTNGTVDSFRLYDAVYERALQKAKSTDAIQNPPVQLFPRQTSWTRTFAGGY